MAQEKDAVFVSLGLQSRRCFCCCVTASDPLPSLLLLRSRKHEWKQRRFFDTLTRPNKSICFHQLATIPSPRGLISMVDVVSSLVVRLLASNSSSSHRVVNKECIHGRRCFCCSGFGGSLGELRCRPPSLRLVNISPVGFLRSCRVFVPVLCVYVCV